MTNPLLAALPDLHAVPSPFWLLTVLHLPTFVLHPVAMAALAAGVLLPLVGVAPLRGGARGHDLAAGTLPVVGLVASVLARHLARLSTLSGTLDPAATTGPRGPRSASP